MFRIARIILPLILCLTTSPWPAGISVASPAPRHVMPPASRNGKPTMMLSPTSGLAGASVAIHVTGAVPGDRLTLRWDHAVLTTTTADATGALTVTFTVPGNALNGAHRVSARGQRTVGTIAATFTVRPQLTLTPSGGVPGSLAQAQGAGYLAGEPVTLTFGSSATVLTTTVAGAGGGFDASITVPQGLMPHAYAVTARGRSGATGSATYNLYYLPALSVQPGAGTPGAGLWITGTGFLANESVIIYWDQGGARPRGERRKVVSYSANADGNGNFIIPAAVPQGFAAGLYHWHAAGQQSLAAADSDFTLYYAPTVTLSQSNETPGKTEGIAGTGWEANETINLSFNGSTMGSLTANQNGAWSASFTVPANPAGSYAVSASGSLSGAAAQATMNLYVPGINLAGTWVYDGENETLHATGYVPNARLDLYVDNKYQGYWVADASGSLGSAGGTFPIPDYGAGNHTVAVTDDADPRETASTTYYCVDAPQRHAAR